MRLRRTRALLLGPLELAALGLAALARPDSRQMVERPGTGTVDGRSDRGHRGGLEGRRAHDLREARLGVGGSSSSIRVHSDLKTVFAIFAPIRPAMIPNGL